MTGKDISSSSFIMSKPSHDRPREATRDHILGLLRQLEACMISNQPMNGRFEPATSLQGSAEPAVEEAVRREVQRRAERCRLFPEEIFGEPAWNILLDLYLSASENRPVTVSDASIASGAPRTTAMRWIDLLVELDLVERKRSGLDQRVVYLRLTAATEQKLVSYFAGN